MNDDTTEHKPKIGRGQRRNVVHFIWRGWVCFAAFGPGRGCLRRMSRARWRHTVETRALYARRLSA